MLSPLSQISSLKFFVLFIVSLILFLFIFFKLNKKGIEKIKYQKATKIDVSDDITMLEKGNGIIRIVEGNSENIKITQPMDLILARTIWEQRAND